MKISQVEWANIRNRFLGELARRGVTLKLRDRVWAVTDTGEWVALPGTSDSPDADKWWLGCDPEKLRARRAIGIRGVRPDRRYHLCGRATPVSRAAGQGLEPDRLHLFLIMRQERVSEALTADVHFVQAGFRALMRE